jgi:hypothetical protein
MQREAQVEASGIFYPDDIEVSVPDDVTGLEAEELETETGFNKILRFGDRDVVRYDVTQLSPLWLSF